MRLFSLLRSMVAPPVCEPGKDGSMIFFPRLHRLAPGLPPLIAVRSPGATGLASSLSGCFSLTGQRCLFRHRRHGERFSRVLPRRRVLPESNAPFVPPFGVFPLAASGFRPKTSARVIRSVLVRSNNRWPSGPLRFTPGPKPPWGYFTRLAAASHRCSSPGSFSRN